MYIAAVRHGRRLRLRRDRHPVPAGPEGPASRSDLAEGLLNNAGPAAGRGRRRASVLFDGLAVPHFNEVDECAGLDALLTNRVWTALGIDPSTTLHDVRWGAPVDGAAAWTSSSGSSRSPARRRPRTSSAATRARAASGSRRCTSRWAAARSRASAEAGRDRLVAASTSRTTRCTWTSAGAASSSCPTRRPSAAGRRRRRSGRSCTPCSTASRATR